MHVKDDRLVSRCAVVKARRDTDTGLPGYHPVGLHKYGNAVRLVTINTMYALGLRINSYTL